MRSHGLLSLLLARRCNQGRTNTVSQTAFLYFLTVALIRSDAGAANCTARDAGDTWEINGTKAWITNGIFMTLVAATTAAHSVSFFLFSIFFFFLYYLSLSFPLSYVIPVWTNGCSSPHPPKNGKTVAEDSGYQQYFHVFLYFFSCCLYLFLFLSSFAFFFLKCIDELRLRVGCCGGVRHHRQVAQAQRH